VAQLVAPLVSINVVGLPDPYRLPTLIREAIWIRKTDNMNRDEESYQLSHVWDKLLHTEDRHRKSVLMKASDVKPKRR